MEIYQNFGSDIELNQNGTIRLVTGAEETIQRVIRRLCTPAFGYVWHANYGAGLPSYVGQPLSQALERQLKGLIIRQMYLEDTVARNPQPKIALDMNGNTLKVSISYAEKNSGEIFTFSFTVQE